MKFDDKGLIVCITQDAVNGDVLMVAYMNQEAFDKTMETGIMHYFSRSRNCLWKKGETSGHYQKVVSAYEDCDKDALLFKVIQTGVACHTGNRTCFFSELANTNEVDFKIVGDVMATIKDRKIHPIEGSYTNYLFAKGRDKICKKFGEEAVESVIAAKNNDKKELIMELSDVVYHALVLMENEGLEIEDILKELIKREGRAAEAKWLARM